MALQDLTCLDTLIRGVYHDRMDKEQYQQARATIFSDIEGSSPDARPCLSVEADLGIRYTAAAVLAPAVMLVGATAAAGITGLAVIPAVAATVATLGSSIGALPQAFSINHYITKAIGAVLGKTVSAYYADHDRAKEWAQKYPEISDALHQWKEDRPGNTLSEAEFKAIRRVVSRINDLDKAYSQLQNEVMSDGKAVLSQGLHNTEDPPAVLATAADSELSAASPLNADTASQASGLEQRLTEQRKRKEMEAAPGVSVRMNKL